MPHAVSQAARRCEIAGKGREGADRLRIAVGRDRDDMGGGPTIKAGRIGIAAGQRRARAA
ncbi:MAG: hypothetical protein MZV64_04640 [Ignavibacteriales bacterium]|nr:hypothetical protein [Ignavibacteriales bacterium]